MTAPVSVQAEDKIDTPKGRKGDWRGQSVNSIAVT
jgi:hypothetical protein